MSISPPKVALVTFATENDLLELEGNDRKDFRDSVLLTRPNFAKIIDRRCKEFYARRDATNYEDPEEDEPIDFQFFLQSIREDDVQPCCVYYCTIDPPDMNGVVELCYHALHPWQPKDGEVCHESKTFKNFRRAVAHLESLVY